MASYKITARRKKGATTPKETRAENILNDLLSDAEAEKKEPARSNSYVGNSEKVKRAEKFIGNKLDAIYGKRASAEAQPADTEDETDLLLARAFDDGVNADGEQLNKRKKKENKSKKASKAEIAAKTEQAVREQAELDRAKAAEDRQAAKISPSTAEQPAAEAEATAATTVDESAKAGDTVSAPPIESFDGDMDDYEYDDEAFESGAPSANANVIDRKPSIDELYAEQNSSSPMADAVKSHNASHGNTATLTRIFSEDFKAQEGIPEAKERPESDDSGFVYEKKRKKVLSDIEEYTSFDQNDEISEGFRDKSVKLLLSAIVLIILTGVMFYLESYSFLELPRFSILRPGRYGIVLLLIDLQIVFASAILILDNIIDGIKSLFTGKANKNSATFLALFAAAVQVIAIIVLNPSGEDISLYSTVAVFFAAMNAVSSFIDVKRNYLTFRIISNKNKDKMVASELGNDCAEAEAFRDTLTEDDRIYTLSKARFINGFFEKLTKNPQCNSVYKISVPLIFVVSVAYAVLNYTSSKSILDAVCSFSLMVAITTPVCSVFVNTLPFAHGCKKASKHEGAIIGEAAIEDYSQASVISFSDTEAFPPKGVKVTSVRTYGENRIDQTILYAAKIFETVGGPLSVVFTNSISGIIPQMDEEVKIIENGDGGICAAIDGKEVYVGSKDYMLSYDFGFIRDDIDADFEENVGRIMYMAIGDEIAAKFYVRYSMSRSFSKLMLKLIKNGVCPSIKTCDPNIDAELVASLMGLEECPVGIVKLHSLSSDVPVKPEADSGIVAGSSISGMLRTFLRCDSIRSHIGTNALVNFISLILGVFIVGFLYFIGRSGNINMLFLLCYQALWLIPVVIPSHLD